MADKKLCLPLQPQTREGVIAQLVEQRTENPCVPGSIPGDTTIAKASGRSFRGLLVRGQRKVAQLVAHYVRDVGVGRSNRLFPTQCEQIKESASEGYPPIEDNTPADALSLCLVPQHLGACGTVLGQRY